MNVETGRLIFTAVFLLLVFALWQNWERRQYDLENPDAASAVPGTPGTSSDESQSVDPDLPQPTVPLQVEDDPDEVPETEAGAAGEVDAQTVEIGNQWLSLQVSSQGGDIVEAGLLKHAASNSDPSPFKLLKQGTDGVFIAQSGLIGSDLPNHKSSFSLVGQEELPGTGKPGSVTLQAQTGAASVRKVISMEENSYIVNIEFDVSNTGADPLTVFAYHQFLHDGTEPESYSSFLPTFFGGAVYNDEERFNKVAFDDFDGGGYPAKSKDGWVGMIERYFLTAWLGTEGAREFFLRETNRGYTAGTIIPVGVLQPGESRSSRMPLYIGAQEQESLHELSESGIAPGIDLAVDYGFLTIIADPMFWVLARTNDYLGNWGIAIIIVTFVIKLLFFPLSAASYKSMARMRAVAPRLQRIKEKHGSDKQATQRAMMALYREEKINPFGGCLPILLQIPFFIALYWVLLGSVELRNAPFFLWIDDLSSPDPWYVMSLLMGALMYAQTRLNPVPPDPTQAMIVKFIPIVFTVFSVLFPSGLVLYWVVNTLLSILQQWQITRIVDAEKSHARRS